MTYDPPYPVYLPDDQPMKRSFRTTKLTAAEATRDKAIRQKIVAEFPPAVCLRCGRKRRSGEPLECKNKDACEKRRLALVERLARK